MCACACAVLCGDSEVTNDRTGLNRDAIFKTSELISLAIESILRTLCSRHFHPDVAAIPAGDIFLCAFYIPVLNSISRHVFQVIKWLAPITHFYFDWPVWLIQPVNGFFSVIKEKKEHQINNVPIYLINLCIRSFLFSESTAHMFLFGYVFILLFNNLLVFFFYYFVVVRQY